MSPATRALVVDGTRYGQVALLFCHADNTGERVGAGGGALKCIVLHGAIDTLRTSWACSQRRHAWIYTWRRCITGVRCVSDCVSSPGAAPNIPAGSVCDWAGWGLGGGSSSFQSHCRRPRTHHSSAALKSKLRFLALVPSTPVYGTHAPSKPNSGTEPVKPNVGTLRRGFPGCGGCSTYGPGYRAQGCWGAQIRQQGCGQSSSQPATFRYSNSTSRALVPCRCNLFAIFWGLGISCTLRDFTNLP